MFGSSFQRSHEHNAPNKTKPKKKEESAADWVINQEFDSRECWAQYINSKLKNYEHIKLQCQLICVFMGFISIKRKCEKNHV